MVELRSLQQSDFHGGLSSHGAGSSIQVRAFCQCGWEGPHRAWAAGTKQLEQADLDQHLAATGHTPFPDGIPGPDRYHHACGHFHDFQHACPAPPDSPRGRLERAMQPTINNRVGALDRLAAIDELRSWLDDQEQMAVIGARMARATWAEMGAAIGTSRQGAWNRWGPMIKRYEEAGLLDNATEADLLDKPTGLAPPHSPVDRLGGALRDLLCAEDDEGSHLLPTAWEDRIRPLVREWEDLSSSLDPGGR